VAPEAAAAAGAAPVGGTESVERDAEAGDTPMALHASVAATEATEPSATAPEVAPAVVPLGGAEGADQDVASAGDESEAADVIADVCEDEAAPVGDDDDDADSLFDEMTADAGCREDEVDDVAVGEASAAVAHGDSSAPAATADDREDDFDDDDDADSLFEEMVQTAEGEEVEEQAAAELEAALGEEEEVEEVEDIEMDIAEDGEPEVADVDVEHVAPTPAALGAKRQGACCFGLPLRAPRGHRAGGHRWLGV